ncbi:MAG: hypothetical protein AB1556_13275 [Bacillota bacterium]
MNYRIDLLPAELRKRPADRLRRFVPLLLTIVVVAGLAAGYSAFLTRCAQISRELTVLNESLPPLRKEAARLEEIKRQRLDLEKRGGELAALLRNRRTCPEILAAVAGVVPDEVRLTGLRLEKATEKEQEKQAQSGPRQAQPAPPGLSAQPAPPGLPRAVIPGVPDTLWIAGASHSAPAVGIFIAQLGQLPYFSKVTLTGLHFEEGEDCLVFAIAASLKEGTPDGKQVE